MSRFLGIQGLMNKKSQLFYGGLTGVLLLMCLSAATLGSIMHESDQASFMDGALQLATGASSYYQPDFYEYDKLYGSYWILALSYKLFSSADPVLVGNLVSFSIFWLGAGLLFLRTKPVDSLLRYVLFMAVLCSPAVLVHVPYFAANFVSAGFLFAGLCCLERRFWLAVLLWGCAMAARMDAVLLVPLLAWLACREPSLKRLAGSGRSWAIAGTAVAVLVLGRLISSGGTGVGYSPFLIPKLYLGYLIFGLGGGLLVLLVTLFLLIKRGVKQLEWDARIYWWLGGAALLVPFCFYSVLLFSTRHWVVCLAGMLLLVCSKRGAELIPVGRVLGLSSVVFAGAFLPLVVGLNLPFVNKPALTVTTPTLFPSADGRCPMGAVFPFMFSEERLDHNHQTWLAARSVEAWDEVEGFVPIASSPLDTIVELAVRCNGQEPSVPFAPAQILAGSFAYIPCRTLLKSRVQLDQSLITSSGVDFTRFSASDAGGHFPYNLVMLNHQESVQSSLLEERIILMQQLFAGNEFRWLGQLPAGVIALGTRAEGCRLVFYSKNPFSVRLDEMEIVAEPMLDFRYYSATIHGADWYRRAIQVSGDVFAAHSVYPDYMQLRVLEEKD